MKLKLNYSLENDFPPLKNEDDTREKWNDLSLELELFPRCIDDIHAFKDITAIEKAKAYVKKQDSSSAEEFFISILSNEDGALYDEALDVFTDQWDKSGWHDAIVSFTSVEIDGNWIKVDNEREKECHYGVYDICLLNRYKEGKYMSFVNICDGFNDDDDDDY